MARHQNEKPELNRREQAIRDFSVIVTLMCHYGETIVTKTRSVKRILERILERILGQNERIRRVSGNFGAYS